MENEKKPRYNILSRVHHAADDRLAAMEDASEDDFRHFDEESEVWADEKEKTVELLSSALAEILAWLVKGKQNHKKWQESVARKTLAMVWAMRPDLLGNKSLRELCNMTGIHVSAPSISFHVSAFTKRFGHFHRGTKSDEARKAYSEARKRVVASGKGKDES